jgi:alpha-tubulin suppressor-like RCC1 family protein
MGLSGVIAIFAGGGNSLALRADGKVIAWGADGYGQGSVPGELTGVIAISAGGGGHNLALTT